MIFHGIRSYLIVGNEGFKIGAKQTISLEYQINIPANMNYNRQSYTMFKTYYRNTETTGEIETTNSSILGLATMRGPELKVEYKASAQNNGIVYENQMVTYEMVIKNVGKVPVNNINIGIQIPNDTVYIEEEDTSSLEREFVERDDVTNINFNPTNLDVNGELFYNYNVKVNNLGELNEKQISSILNVSADVIGTMEPIIITNTVNKAKIEIELLKTYTLDLYENEEFADLIRIKNISNEIINDIVIEDYLSEYYTFVNADKFQTILEAEDKSDSAIYNEEKNKISWNIPTLNVGEWVQAGITMKVIDNITQDLHIKNQAIANIGSDKYNSNYVYQNIRKIDLEIIQTANRDEGYVKENESVEYTIKVVNNGNVKTPTVEITDELPVGFVTDLYYYEIDGEVISGKVGVGGIIGIMMQLEAKESIELIIQGHFNELEEGVNELEVANKAIVKMKNKVIESEEIIFIVQNVIEEVIEEPPEDYPTEGIPDYPTIPDNPEEPDDPDNPD
ncbi:MAG: hypothetical protein Q4G05_01765, partial [Clostridia bacterium]|nr:hypothetical protein [Clostridia bacterium]